MACWGADGDLNSPGVQISRTLHADDYPNTQVIYNAGQADPQPPAPPARQLAEPPGT